MLLLLLKTRQWDVCTGRCCPAKESGFGSLPNFCCSGKRSGMNRIGHPDWVKLCVELICAPNQNTNFSPATDLWYSLNLFISLYQFNFKGECALLKRPETIQTTTQASTEQKQPVNKNGKKNNCVAARNLAFLFGA